jgi:hypothetical protein
VFFYASDSTGSPTREALGAEEIARRLEVLAALLQLSETGQREYLDAARKDKREEVQRLEEEALRKHPIVTGVAGLDELRLLALRPASGWTFWAPRPAPAVEVISGSVCLRVRGLSPDAAANLVAFLEENGELTAAALSSTFKYNNPQTTPWIATTCPTLADNIDERKAEKAVREVWKAASADSVVFRLYGITKAMADSHEEASLMWHAINAYYLNVTGRCPLVRILFFDSTDKLILSKLVTRISPTGHSAILPRLSKALQSVGFSATSSPDSLQPPVVRGVSALLLAWSDDVLDTCSRLISAHYSNACVVVGKGRL